jgi:hypothetical protein
MKLSSLDIKAKLPEMPQSMPVFALGVPSLDDRRSAIARLGDHLKLGALRPVGLDHGVVLASERGDITYFHASGALSARDGTASKGAENEFRKWDGATASTTDGQRVMLNADASKRLIAQAKELFQAAGLLDGAVASEAVQLDQVAQLDAKGNELAHGAGQATIKFSYAAGGVPVRGPGAKTIAFAEPGDSGVGRFAGLFHAWRPVGQGAPVKVPSLEEALGVGLLTDPELDRYSAAGHKVQITRLELVYLGLPAFMRQTHLFPAFQVEGTVSEGKLGIMFHFARYHHAVPAQAYAAANLYGSYLAANPDGIGPASGRNALN